MNELWSSLFTQNYELNAYTQPIYLYNPSNTSQTSSNQDCKWAWYFLYILETYSCQQISVRWISQYENQYQHKQERQWLLMRVLSIFFRDPKSQMNFSNVITQLWYCTIEGIPTRVKNTTRLNLESAIKTWMKLITNRWELVEHWNNYNTAWVESKIQSLFKNAYQPN